MLQLSVDNNQFFEIDHNLVNGLPFEADILSLREGHFHVIKDNRSYNVEVLEANASEKTFRIKVNERIYSLSAKDKFDLLLEKMGLNSTAKSKINDIKAPMPGLIWDVNVQVGDAVKSGDTLLVLVAMKMENAIKAQGDGTIKNIKINKNDTVNKGQVLIEFE